MFPVVLNGKVSASNEYPQHMGLETRENLPLWVCEQQMPDQAVHPRSPISAFVIYLFESNISILATSKIFQLVSVAEETGLSLALSETPKTGFVLSRPIYF